jgi:hypothetical protein
VSKLGFDRLDDRPRARGQMREHPTAVLDCDLELVALDENPVLTSALGSDC